MILRERGSKALLLDTCAIIYIFNGEPIAQIVIDEVEFAGRQHGIFVSPISAWEIGMLSQRSRSLSFAPDAKTWFNTVLAVRTVRLAPFTADIAIESSMLPPPIHKDPADRLLIATARNLNVTILTRDRLILDYADAGHVDAIVC
jgi:PIN domain nuclease of toxin-antitoxin system